MQARTRDTPLLRKAKNGTRAHPVPFWKGTCVLPGWQNGRRVQLTIYEGWNFNSGNYLFTTDTK